MDEDVTSSSAFPGLEAEKEFYLRFCRFLTLLTAIVLLALLSQYAHDNIPLIVVGVFLGSGLLYMLGSLVGTVFVNSQKNALRNVLTEEELQEMERDSDDDDDNDDDRGSNGVGRMALYSFEDTPDYIRTCLEEISPHCRPPNGQYKIVYNAVYFGKSIRSESRMHLQFQPAATKANGWELTGAIVSGSAGKVQNTQNISEGFMNAKGEVYWKLDNNLTTNGIYRGCFDFRSNAMFDGEFQAGNAPQGRIVRLEFLDETPMPTPTPTVNHYVTEGWGSDDVEMVVLDKSFT